MSRGDGSGDAARRRSPPSTRRAPVHLEPRERVTTPTTRKARQYVAQGIETYTYFHDGDPLLVVDTPPKRGDYPGQKYVVHQTTKRRSVRGGGGSGDPETAYHLYSQSPSGQWTLKVGAQQTIPKTSVDVEKLEACADNSKNNWASSITGTLEQVNAQTPQQYEDLYEAVGVDATSFISIRKANLTVNGASLLFRYICSFRT